MSPKKVTILGGGSWYVLLSGLSLIIINHYRGTAIARIIGRNAQQNSDMFDSKITMWVFEEQVDGRKLTEIINTHHENVKYMPGVKIPENVVCIYNRYIKQDLIFFIACLSRYC